MIRKANWAWSVIYLSLFIFTSEAHAQTGSNYFGETARVRRPFRTSSYQASPLSPYINLTRTDASPTTNYFTLVQPQLDAAAMKVRPNATPGAVQGQLFQNMPVTKRAGQSGHVSRFMDYSNFFFRKPGQ